MQLASFDSCVGLQFKLSGAYLYEVEMLPSSDQDAEEPNPCNYTYSRFFPANC